MARVSSKENKRMQDLGVKDTNKFLGNTKSWTTIGDLRKKRKKERNNRKQNRKK